MILNPPYKRAENDEYGVVKHYQDFLRELPFKAWVAGGAIRSYVVGAAPHDIDLHPAPGVTDLEVISFFTQYWNGDIHRATPRSTKFIFPDRAPVDVIRGRGADPLETISSFDYTIVSAAVSEYGLHYHKRFFEDIRSKNLVVLNPIDPLDTLRRAQKFIARGYTFQAPELLRLVRLIRDMSKEDFAAAESIVEGLYYLGNEET